MADGRGRRGQPQLAPLGCGEPGEQPQQGGLARTVGADETDHVAGRDDQVEPGEQGAVAVPGGEVLHDECGSHQDADPNGPGVRGSAVSSAGDRCREHASRRARHEVRLSPQRPRVQRETVLTGLQHAVEHLAGVGAVQPVEAVGGDPHPAGRGHLDLRGAVGGGEPGEPAAA